jgi:uncharacterized protein (TIGR03437 family)
VPFSVNNNGVRSAGTIKLVDASPGIFTADGSGTGMPSALCLSKFAGLADIYSEPPCAASGNSLVSILILFGTGWRNAPGTQVKINGATLTPFYSGVEGGGSLRDQINLVVPSDLVGLTNTDLWVVTSGNNIESNRVKVSFQDISTMLSILEGSAGVECISKTPGMPDTHSEPPCAVSNGSTTGILVLYGTGWRNAPNPQVKFEEVTLNPIYSGPSGIHPEIAQMNIQLPSSLAGRTGQVSVIIPGTDVESNSEPVSFLPLP